MNIALRCTSHTCIRYSKSQLSAELLYPTNICVSSDITVVPILVGSIDLSQQKTYGSILAPYFADPENFFVISCDFCHW